MRNLTIILLSLVGCTTVQDYSTCESWDELVAGNDYQYVTPVRVSDPGSNEQPVYTGFWFYDEQQFDITGRPMTDPPGIDAALRCIFIKLALQLSIKKT